MRCRCSTITVTCLVLVELLCCTAAQQQQRHGLAASITRLQPEAQSTYTWRVTNTVDKPSISVAVGADRGFATVQYTVSYMKERNEQQTYVLSGSLEVQDTNNQGEVLDLPVVSVLTGRGVTLTLPSSNVNCPSLTVSAGGKISCTFSASYTGDQPLPGSVTARVTIAGTRNNLTAPAVPFDFIGAPLSEPGGVALTSSYFEQGDGLLQPFGVAGNQPPPGMSLVDSATYSFTGYFGNIPSERCGQQWQSINTASVTTPDPIFSTSATQTGSSKVSNAAQRAVALVTINLLGCDAAGNSTTAFTDTSSSGTQSPATAGPPPVITTPPAPPATSAPPPPAAGRPPRPAAPSDVTFAEAGSTLCGSGVCPPGQRCFDGWNCCDSRTSICGGVCCDGGRVCLLNQCVAAGSTICGESVCAPGQVCSDGVCCSSGQQVCGTQCCTSGQICVNQQCVAAGSTACGSAVCSPTQQCVGGAVCCDGGATACGGRCCGSGNTCLSNQFCVPTGSTLCAGTVCQPPQQCASGLVCCDAGATFCGGSCCPASNTCQNNRCIPVGSSVCGGNICSPSQTCQGNSVCCDQGATFCNNGCCPQGNTCINNQCVPPGSSACGATVICPVNQFCGNPTTGICCQTNNQVGCYNSCCRSPEQVCNQNTRQCVDRWNTACAPGTVWCAGANQCCPVGQLCLFGQCLTSNAVGRRLRQSGADHHPQWIQQW